MSAHKIVDILLEDEEFDWEGYANAASVELSIRNPGGDDLSCEFNLTRHNLRGMINIYIIFNPGGETLSHDISVVGYIEKSVGMGLGFVSLRTKASDVTVACPNEFVNSNFDIIKVKGVVEDWVRYDLNQVPDQHPAEGIAIIPKYAFIDSLRRLANNIKNA